MIILTIDAGILRFLFGWSSSHCWAPDFLARKYRIEAVNHSMSNSLKILTDLWSFLQRWRHNRLIASPRAVSTSLYCVTKSMLIMALIWLRWNEYQSSNNCQATHLTADRALNDGPGRDYPASFSRHAIVLRLIQHGLGRSNQCLSLAWRLHLKRKFRLHIAIGRYST